jgi:uncharacterized radical SAM superfamily Fe-S cluster-containing enzyme
MKLVKNTDSVCPLCFQDGKINKIVAQLIEDQGKIWIIKKCSIHGSFREIYFNDENTYNRWMNYMVTGLPVSEIKTSLFNDPPLYSMHISQPILINLVITNRSNLRDSDCFLNAFDTGYIYEPPFEMLNKLMQQAKGTTPPGSYAIQITGGEPTLREDLFEILRLAKKLDFSHIQLQTNGIKIAENINYCQLLKNSGIDTVYMRFDGVTNGTNQLLSYHIKALENLRNVNLNVVLVPVLIGNKNIHESGKIIRFALNNIDIVKGVHFLPISFNGQLIKINEEERKRQRVDFIQIIDNIEHEFADMISRDDFYPISFIDSISQLIEAKLREPQIRFTAHPCCGGSTFLFIEEEKPLPVTRFINVHKVDQFINRQKKKKGPLPKLRLLYAFVKNIDSFVDEKKAPVGFDLRRIARETATIGDQYAMREFNHKTLFVGLMWYQDIWNLDVDRLQRCVIHYSTPEGIISYCLYHGLGYGEKIQRKYSMSIKEWEQKNDRRLEDDLQKDIK